MLLWVNVLMYGSLVGEDCRKDVICCFAPVDTPAPRGVALSGAAKLVVTNKGVWCVISTYRFSIRELWEETLRPIDSRETNIVPPCLKQHFAVFLVIKLASSLV